jgi:hypothetical protein
LCAYCAGVPPDDLPPCGTCEALPACLDFGVWEPDGCPSGGNPATTQSAWDGKVYLVEGSCRYESRNDAGGPAVEIDGKVYYFYLVRYSDSEADPPYCYWRMTIQKSMPTGGGSGIVWVGTTADDDPTSTFTRQDGCDATATIALGLCSRRIRVTFSGITACCLGADLVKPDAATIIAHNAVFEFDEDSPGSGTWTDLAFMVATLDTYNSAPCGGGVASSTNTDMAISVTYDGVSTWVISTANMIGYSVTWFIGTDTGGDETGATVTSIQAGCNEGGYSLYADSGSCTIEVL